MTEEGVVATPSRGSWWQVSIGSYGNLLVIAVVAVATLFWLSTYVIIHYFSRDVFTSVLYAGVEPCWPGVPTIGYHCFGDFSVMRLVVFSADPWDVPGVGTWNYPASGMIPSLIFIAIGKLVGSDKAGLLLYLGAAMVSLAFPAYWAARYRPLTARIVIWSSFGILSVPTLMALDRGNVVAFAVPAIMIAVFAFARGANATAVIALSAAALVKPQFAFAVLAFLIVARYRWFFISIGAVIVSNLAAFLLWPAHFPSTLVKAVNGILFFGNGGTSGLTRVGPPTNSSIAEGIYLVEFWTRQALGLDAKHTFVAAHDTLVSGIAVVLVVAAIWFARRRMSPALLIAMLFLISAIAVPTTFTYYYVAALPVAAVVLRDPTAPVHADSRVFTGVLDQGSTPRWPVMIASVFLILTLAVTVSRIVLATPVVPNTPYVQTNGELLGIQWVVAVLWFCLAVRLTRRRESELAA
ncbi:hypothetical protein [Microbacterium capsulatum]|uniref:DUF2029 domain-containing protein n=1 Tax=Microbacterium capsulatum TaxID=3041921 RepID=A0ABU0XMS6_9MICO|nr:hypothetical protein [Microbacterium sp. ASV81]MDQ4215385.1 hypothetical protein [Microbacterium sp. ASV81]